MNDEIQTRIATNVSEFMDIIMTIPHGHQYWFRGQGKATHRLLPSLFREYRTLGDKYKDQFFMKKSDAVMKDDLFAIEKFKEYYDKKHDTSEFAYIDYLFIMQHYEMQTRLLDFSTDPLIALYFSVAKDDIDNCATVAEEIQSFKDMNTYTEAGSTVFCIDPLYTNQQTIGKNKIIDPRNLNRDFLRKLDLPICIKADSKDLRIAAQKGNFGLFGYMNNPLDYYSVLRPNTYKIFIPNSCRKEIKRALKEEYDISHIKMFPDIKGIMLQITDDIEDNFRDKCNAVFD